MLGLCVVVRICVRSRAMVSAIVSVWVRFWSRIIILGRLGLKTWTRVRFRVLCQCDVLG